MNDSQVAVETSQWRSRVRQLTEDCICGSAAEQEQSLREMRALQESSPASILARFAPLRPRDEFERLVAARAWESAVLGLLGPQAAFICSRGAGNLHIATLVTPGCELEHNGEGASFALALLAAIGEAMLAGMPDRGEFARQGLSRGLGQAG